MSPDPLAGAGTVAAVRYAACVEAAGDDAPAHEASPGGFAATAATTGIGAPIALAPHAADVAPAVVTGPAPSADGEPALADDAAAADRIVWGDDDRRWMQRALELARAAEAAGEVPVGAVLVRDGVLLGEAGNGPIGHCDPSAHAEILALRAAGRAAGNYRLPGSTLYVTLEPCPMCAGALVHARIARVVYAAPDPRTGAAGSLYDLLRDPRLNHRCEVNAGLAADASAELLRRFFRARRKPAAPPTDPAG